MRYFLIILISLLSLNAEAKKIIVAVLDTGFAYNIESLPEKHLCKYGHKDFTPDKKYAKYLDTKDKVPQDYVAHGTQMVGIIDNFAGNANYCLVIIKWFSGTENAKESGDYSRQAIQYAVNLKVDVINFSGGGSDFNELENKAIKKFLNRGGIFVAAAGNNGQDLGIQGNTFYPAMYDSRIKVVGNKREDGSRQAMSNYGTPVKYWENGVDIHIWGMTGTGTSQATATLTGKIINKLRK